MLTIFFHFFLFFLIMYGNGVLFLKKILKFEESNNLYEITLIGLIVTLFSAQFLNFFIPLNDYLIIANLIFLLFYMFFDKKIFIKNLNFDYKIFIILSLLSFVNIYGSGFSDDINHYHYGFITNSDELNLIWGYTYLHPLYGTMPLWLVGHSYFNFDYSRLQDIHVLNGIIFFLVSALFLEEFKNSKFKKNFFYPFLFSILLFIFFKYTRLKEFGIDRPAILLFCFSIFYYLKYILFQNKYFYKNFIILCLISTSIFFIKIIYAPVILLPILIFFSNTKQLLRYDFNFYLIIIIIFIFFSKNLLSSGCLIFPLDISCIDLIKWTNSYRINEIAFSQEFVNKSWSSYDGNLDERLYIREFNWFNVWFDRGKTEIIELVSLTLLITLISLYFYSVKYKNFSTNFKLLKHLNIYLILLMVSTLFLFFYKNPVIRMNHHFLISFILLIISFFSNFDFKKKRKNLIVSFLIFGLLFNLTKNLFRIHDSSFINDPYKQVSNIIRVPHLHILDNFTYYQGWFGKSPIGNQKLDNRKHKKLLIFNIIY